MQTRLPLPLAGAIVNIPQAGEHNPCFCVVSRREYQSAISDPFVASVVVSRDGTLWTVGESDVISYPTDCRTITHSLDANRRALFCDYLRANYGAFARALDYALGQ